MTLPRAQVLDIAQGVHYLQEEAIVHLDIKPVSTGAKTYQNDIKSFLAGECTHLVEGAIADRSFATPDIAG